MALLQSLPRTSNYVFPGRSRQSGEGSFGETIIAFKGDTSPHGLRSTFSDCASECRKFEKETIEHALAHSVGTKVAQAYARGTHLEKRRLLMQAWGSYCDGGAQADNVVKLHA